MLKIDNMFSVKNIDVASFSYPEVKVQGWSNLFGKNEDGVYGSMCIETEKGEYGRITLYSVDVDDSVDKEFLREELNEYAKDWNGNLKENWNNEFIRCFTELAKYEQRQIDSMSEHVTNLEKYKKQIEELNK